LTYAFARSMTTLSPIIFITTPKTKIMTSQILSEVDAGRFGNAFAFCTLLNHSHLRGIPNYVKKSNEVFLLSHAENKGFSRFKT